MYILDCLASEETCKQEESEYQFENNDYPQLADARLRQQHLQLIVQFHHIIRIFLDFLIYLVQHFILKFDLSSKILVLESDLLDYSCDSVELAILLGDHIFLLLQ